MRAKCTVVAAVGAIALAAPASPAFAAGFTLNLSAPSTPVVGKPMILRATGTIPVEDIQFPYTSVVSSCPADHFAAKQVAIGTGGSIVILSQSEVPDAAGNWSIPIGVTPSAPGSLLLCGYTDDGAATTLARTSLIFNIQPAPSTRAPASGRRATIPEEARSGIRGCRALLRDSSGCERRVIRRANARCRRLPSRRSRTRCLRGVSRLARSR
jgi:hypothetical protein